jgi:hypothetical protein
MRDKSGLASGLTLSSVPLTLLEFFFSFTFSIDLHTPNIFSEA